MPISLHVLMNLSEPYENTTFAYVMNTIGIVTFLRSFLTRSNTLSVVTPPASALIFAPWMTGPSAVGSENGIPSSIRSAPASTIAYTTSSVTSSDGSPHVTNGINAFPCSNAFAILLMKILPSVSCDGCNVLIATS